MSPESPTLDRQEEAERANKQPTQPIPVPDRLDLIKVGTRGDEALGLVMRYGGAMLAVAAATGLRWSLQGDIGTGVKFVAYYPAVALVALLAGGGPGVLATVLSVAVVRIWIGFGTGTAGEVIAMGLFISSGLIVSLTAEMLHRARRREVAVLEVQFAERKQAAETLQQRVAEQTREIQLLAEAVSHLAEGVVITDEELDWPGPRIRFVNEAMCRITGYSAEELIGQTPRILQGNQSDRATLERLKGELAAGGPFLCELVNYRKDGTPYDAELFITPLFDAAGHRTNFVSIHRDITERKRADAALRESEERMSLAVRATRDGIWDCDLVRGTVWWNETYNELFGNRPLETNRGWQWWIDHLHPEERQHAMDGIRAAIDGDAEFWTAEYRYRRTSGDYADVVDRGFVVRDDQGKATRILGAMTDVTERKQAEEKLRESEERLRIFIEHAPAAIAMFDREMRYLAVSRRWLADYQLGDGDIIGRSHYEVFREISESWKAVHRRGLEGEVVRADEDRFQRANGSVQWVKWEVRPWYAANGAIGGIVILTEDVTTRKQAMELLQDREARLRAILATAVDAIITFDEHGIIDSVNPATERLFGYSAGEILGRNVNLLMPSPYREEHDEYIANYLRTGVQRIIGIGHEVQGRRKDGTVFPAELAVSDLGDRQRWFTGIIHDLSRRKALEREVVEVAVQEQQHVGRELHDSVGQELTGMGLLASALLRRLEQSRSAEQELAGKLALGLQRVHEQVRALCHGLMEVELDAEGLRAALTGLAARTSEQSGIACWLDCPEPVSVEDPVTAKHLYRISQEAVSNALHHGGPQHIELILQRGPDGLRLSIQDDGIGVPDQIAYAFPETPGSDTGGMGIPTMRYRAGLIGGTLQIGSAAKGGTLVTCFVPRREIGERF